MRVSENCLYTEQQQQQQQGEHSNKNKWKSKKEGAQAVPED